MRLTCRAEYRSTSSAPQSSLDLSRTLRPPRGREGLVGLRVHRCVRSHGANAVLASGIAYLPPRQAQLLLAALVATFAGQPPLLCLLPEWLLQMKHPATPRFSVLSPPPRQPPPGSTSSGIPPRITLALEAWKALEVGGHRVLLPFCYRAGQLKKRWIPLTAGDCFGARRGKPPLMWPPANRTELALFRASTACPRAAMHLSRRVYQDERAKGNALHGCGLAFSATFRVRAADGFLATTTVRLWHPDGSAAGAPLIHSGQLKSVAWAPDSRRIASATNDGRIRTWRSDGTLLKSIVGHAKWVNGVAWSPSGDALASAEADTTIQFWHRVLFSGHGSATEVTSSLRKSKYAPATRPPQDGPARCYLSS